MRFQKFVILAFGLSIVSSFGLAQTITGAYSVKRNEDRTAELVRSLLSDCGIARVPKLLFGPAYDDELADLIIFIDKTGHFVRDRTNSSIDDRTARMALVRKGRIRQTLFGEKYVYILVFMAEKIDDGCSVARKIPAEDAGGSDSEKAEKPGAEPSSKDATTTTPPAPKTKSPISVSLASLDSAANSGEFIFYSVLGSVLSGAAVNQAEKPAKPDDTVESPLTMTVVGPLSSDRIFFGIKKVPLAENTINRVSVKEELETGSNSYLATFGNYSGSIITSSIGLVLSERFGNERDEAVPADGFIFANFYIFRPQVPSPRYPRRWLKTLWKRISISAVVGTKISASLFDDLFVGVNIGHFLSNFGLMIGANFKMRTVKVGDQERKERRPHFAFGFNFIF